MAYTDIDDPSAYFQTTLYTGDGSTDLAITNSGNSDLQPDMVWIKNRDQADWHHITDVARGVNKVVYPNDTNAEQTTNYVKAFNSDGFTIGASGHDVNANAEKYVAWQWKAGTSFTNDASSTGIGDIDSAGSVNTDAGFSVITATSDGAANKDIAHGLGAVPDVIFAKNLERGYNWDCYFKTLGYNASLILNTTEAARTGAWGSNTFTTTTFETAEDYSSKSGEKYVYYCFAEKKGYSKFGSYVGNGNVDGTFVYTGQKSAFIIIKKSSNAGNNWYMWDNKRNTFNLSNTYLNPDLASAEGTANYGHIDILSNGFKIRSASNDEINQSGHTFIYMAFAENPFVSSSGVPATAR